MHSATTRSSWGTVNPPMDNGERICSSAVRRDFPILHWMNRHRQTDAVRRDVLKQVLAIVGSRSLNVEVSGLAKVKPSASETVRESVLLGTILASDSATLRDWLGLAYPGRGSIASGL